MNKNKIFMNAAVIVVAVILLLALRSGYSSGKRGAEAEVVSANARSLKAGLENFYGDNGRFPTAAEYADTRVLGQYFSAFPPADFVSGPCESSYQYRRVRAGSAELYFCLPKGIAGFREGWNTTVSSH